VSRQIIILGEGLQPWLVPIVGKSHEMRNASAALTANVYGLRKGDMGKESAQKKAWISVFDFVFLLPIRYLNWDLKTEWEY
jgi:hypothetical protein